MSRHSSRCAILLACFVLSRPAYAVFDVIIDDSDMTVDFSEWGTGVLQMATGDNSYGGSYHYVTNWLESGQASARVFYRLPHGVDFPSGERLYNIYAWSPTNGWNQHHIIEVAADGTEHFQQNISWGGQFNTNKQWIAFDPNAGIDPNLGGRWVKLGPGPQTDMTADGGRAVHINPGSGPEPYFYLGYQLYYEGTIAFDAIRIIEVAPPGVAGDFDSDGDVDGADFVIWQTNFPTSAGAILGQGDSNGDGDVDGGDFAAWQENFPHVPSSGASPVPEPGSIILVLGTVGCAGMLAVAKSARRKFSSSTKADH